jgi:general secretion pathway protein G
MLLLLFACHEGDDRRVAEQTLRTELHVMRIAIRNFRNDKLRYPQSLEELKSGRYLRAIPIDPITHARNWRLTTEETVRTDEFSGKPAAGNTTALMDVHSSAPGRDGSGKPYGEY